MGVPPLEEEAPKVLQDPPITYRQALDLAPDMFAELGYRASPAYLSDDGEFFLCRVANVAIQMCSMSDFKSKKLKLTAGHLRTCIKDSVGRIDTGRDINGWSRLLPVTKEK